MEKDKVFAAKVLVDEKVAMLGMMMVAGQEKDTFSNDVSRKRAVLDTDDTAPVWWNKKKVAVKVETAGPSKDPAVLIAEFLEHMEKHAVAREKMRAKELEEEWWLWAEELEEQCKLWCEEMQLCQKELELAHAKAALEKQQ